MTVKGYVGLFTTPSKYNRKHILEAVSKPQIMFDGKARDGEKAQHTW